MFKRIKRMYDLSKKDPKALSNLTDEQIENLPDIGDGKAVFFGEGTEEEFKDLQEADKGLKGIFGLKS